MHSNHCSKVLHRLTVTEVLAMARDLPLSHQRAVASTASVDDVKKTTLNTQVLLG